MQLALLVVLLSFFSNINCQTQSITVNNVFVRWTNRGSSTDFFLTSSLSPDVSANDGWVGVGINNGNTMGGSNIIACRNSATVREVRHYYSQVTVPFLLDNSNPSIGLSNAVVSQSQGNITCSFTRLNTYSLNRYYSINTNIRPYIITAFGTGDVTYHFQNRGASETTVSFPV